MKLKNIVFLIPVILTISCGLSGGSIPADHYYRLPEIAAEKSNEFKINNFLLNPVKVEGLYYERAILYVEQLNPLEVKRYHYHYWVETPAKLTQKYVQRYLLQTGTAKNLTFNAANQAATVQADITIANFERIIQAKKVYALVSLRISLKSNKDSKSDFSQLYTEKVQAESIDMHATVKAFGQALNKIMSKLVANLDKIK